MTRPAHIVTFHRPLRDARLSTTPAQNSPTRVTEHTVQQENELALAEDRRYVRAAMSQIAGLIQDLDARNQQSLEALEQIAVDLAVTVAGQIAFQEVHSDQFPVAEIVAEFLNRFEVEISATVFLHPLDLKKLQNDWQVDAAAEDVKPLKLDMVGDPELPRGSVRMLSDATELFFSVATQLSEIRQELMERLYDAKIERRTTKDADSSLRRFPDRRASG